MKRVSYGGASFLTADRVADALLLLVAAIRDHHGAEVVELPAVGNGGEPVVVQLVVGPASEIISMSEGAPGAEPGSTEPGSTEPDTTEVVDYLLDRIQDLSLTSPPTLFETKAEPDSLGWDDLDLA